MRALTTLAAAMLIGAIALGGCAALLGDSAGLAPTGGLGAGGSAGAPGTPAVPAQWESWEQGAAATCPGLSWSVLGAIGWIESDSGQSDAPGVASGANAAGAEGPMQFEPATFAAYATVGPAGAQPADPYDPVDALYTAAKMLCADGASTPGGLEGAVWAYNHSPTYVGIVLVVAQGLWAAPDLGASPVAALGFAAGQFGVPYRWGGTGPGGWDCSGLVQAAYRAGGVVLPRVAQAQFDAGPPVPDPAAIRPGDLVFFGASPGAVEHVGLYVSEGEMIDAPYTGTVVREEPVHDGPPLVGITQPGE